MGAEHGETVCDQTQLKGDKLRYMIKYISVKQNKT
jgi:hypothetical protein